MTDKNRNERKKILLIEDDTLLVNMYRTKFENEGFAVVTANDGEEGLNKATKEEVDMIILDLMLPKLSGIDMLEKLRTKKKGKNVPVIVLTNLTQEKEAMRAKELGAKEYLVKANLTPTQLVEEIVKYIN